MGGDDRRMGQVERYQRLSNRVRLPSARELRAILDTGSQAVGADSRSSRLVPHSMVMLQNERKTMLHVIQCT